METVTQKGRHTTHRGKILQSPEKWESKVMHGQCIRSTHLTACKLIRHVAMAVDGRSESRNWKWKSSSTRQSITNKISCNRNITNWNRQQMLSMSTIWWDSRPYHIIMRNSGKITIHKRHDTVSPQLHFNICKETEVKLDKEHWCQHVPESVETSREGKVNVLWS